MHLHFLTDGHAIVCFRRSLRGRLFCEYSVLKGVECRRALEVWRMYLHRPPGLRSVFPHGRETFILAVCRLNGTLNRAGFALCSELRLDCHNEG